MDETERQIAEVMARVETLEQMVSNLADSILKLEGILTDISNSISKEDE
jgi:predicted  nucleic acid-binding Zn-ribbon protein